MKIKNHIIEHANQRFFERTENETTRKEIIKHLNNGGEIIYAKRTTNSRSLVYVPIQKEIFKLIINRKNKKIITFLPWKEVFKTFFQFEYEEKKYFIELYPDCFEETKCENALTTIYEINEKEEIQDKIKFNHPLFKNLFNEAWKNYKDMKNYVEAVYGTTSEIIKTNKTKIICK